MKTFLTLLFALGMAGTAAAQTYAVTFIVDMNEVAEDFTTPEVNGTFNGWCGGCAPMTDDDGDNIWEITIDLEAGFYEYKFAADTWTIQETLTPGDPCTMTTDIFTNRTLDVSEDMVLDTVCWGSCDGCDVEAAVYSVTFQVDMSEVTDAYTTPEVNGTFNGWCGGCAPMTDDDGDNIWEITIDLEEGFYEYKFAADTWTIQEELTPGDPCTMTTDIFTNRTLDLTGDVTLDPVCWGSCEACAGSSETYAVTFIVDMNEVTDAFTTPEVNGTFNGWCGGCAPMTDDDGDNIWEITIDLEAGFYEYKFAADTWTIQEELTPGDPCTMTTDIFTNRTIDVSADAVQDTVCWASCDACASVPNAIGDLTLDNVTVWPQPANELLQVNLGSVPAPGTTIDIRNINGQLMMTVPATGNLTTMDMQSVPAGCYLLTVNLNGERLYHQTVIMQ